MGASVALRRIGDRREQRGDRSFVHDADLHTAARHGDRATLRRLLAEGASPVAIDAAGFTALHHAAFAGHAGLVRLLLAAGAPIDTRSVHRRCCTGATALHLAVAGRRVGATELLLRAGAHPAAKDEAGWTPLHVAADQGDLEIVRLLLLAKAPVDVWVGDVSPLDLARRGRHAAVVGLLRQQGAH